MLYADDPRGLLAFGIELLSARPDGGDLVGNDHGDGEDSDWANHQLPSGVSRGGHRVQRKLTCIPAPGA